MVNQYIAVLSKRIEESTFHGSACNPIEIPPRATSIDPLGFDFHLSKGFMTAGLLFDNHAAIPVNKREGRRRFQFWNFK
jgi:hypothetical protein